MFAFLLQAIAVSLSGVMAPGPMTATALAAGVRRRHAGLYMALGHAVIEFPLMLVIVSGAGRMLEYRGARAAIGITGGAFLIFMGAQLLRDIRKAATAESKTEQTHPFVAGILLSGGNPYFLLWWATIGLALAGGAAELGAGAFALFAAAHWLCDLFWLEALTMASFKGRELVGGRAQKVVMLVCAVTVLLFGVKFIADGVMNLIG
ncbi:MAG TPA: LysE family transporter [Candidatus Brocadiia bacterium]|nr:LysE family transporter [Candidatus Brocadiia bacterium]